MWGPPMSDFHCLRCKTQSLAELVSGDQRIRFFECPQCQRHYALQPGKRLTFRWLHPVSLVIYSWLYRSHPHIDSMAAEFVNHRSPEELQRIVEEVRLELDEPTQDVRDILDSATSEKDLREMLREFVGCVERQRRVGSP